MQTEQCAEAWGPASLTHTAESKKKKDRCLTRQKAQIEIQSCSLTSTVTLHDACA